MIFLFSANLFFRKEIYSYSMCIHIMPLSIQKCSLLCIHI